MTKVDLQEVEIKAYLETMNKVEVPVQTGAALYSIVQKLQQAITLEKRDALKQDIKKAVAEDPVFAKELETHIDKNKKT